MHKANQETKKLMPWYEHMLSSVPYMIIFILLSVIAFPILLVYGALLPLFHR